MNYEKKYKEALEKARYVLHTVETAGCVMHKDLLEEIFPELRESEDERIRRTLVEYFGPKAQLDFVRGVPIQKIRDWLEKQKEQKENKPNLLKSLEEYLEKTPKKQLDADWEKLKVWNEIAPDVIYVEFSEEVNLAFEKQPFEETPAYIRKDALLEWAKANLQDRDNWNEKSAADAFCEVIDKLNEM